MMIQQVRGWAAGLAAGRVRRGSPRTTDVELPSVVLVGTHHRAGTVWLSSIFSQLADQLGLGFDMGMRHRIQPGAYIHFDHHSAFDLSELDRDHRGLHVRRDPRDVVVSAAHYHRHSAEPWLHEPRPEFDGLTYQEKLNSLPTAGDRLLMEMEHSSGGNIRQMVDWVAADAPDFLEVRFEDLMVDHDLVRFHQIFVHLGFPGGVIPDCLRVAYDNSLFSGNVEKTTHVRSGASGQWRTVFERHHRERFVELFPGALERLGYEPDDSWVESAEDHEAVGSDLER